MTEPSASAPARGRAEVERLIEAQHCSLAWFNHVRKSCASQGFDDGAWYRQSLLDAIKRLSAELAALPVSPAPTKGDRERLIAIMHERESLYFRREQAFRDCGRGYQERIERSADALLASDVGFTPEGDKRAFSEAADIAKSHLQNAETDGERYMCTDIEGALRERAITSDAAGGISARGAYVTGSVESIRIVRAAFAAQDRCEALDRAITNKELVRPSPSFHDGVEQAARALIAKMEEVHQHPDYKSVWVNAYVHGGMYYGPTYRAELEALRRSITPQATGGGR